MFDFLQTDNRPNFEIIGITLPHCEYTSCIRDDIRLLLSQRVDVNKAVEKVLNYYTSNLKSWLSSYEYLYYLPLTYISLAYYLAKNGYYDEETFKKAVDYIDSESTLFPWKDAISYQNAGVNALNEVLIENFGDRANEIAKLISDEPYDEDFILKKENVPRIITQILFLDGSAKYKYEKRKKVLQNVKDFILSPLCPVKKPNVSSVLYCAKGYKFTTDYCEGDVLAYKIKTGKNIGKYAIFIVDYIREIRKILCDSDMFVEKWEYLALVDGLYDSPPQKIPNKFLSTGQTTDFDGKTFYFNHLDITVKTDDFNFIKVGAILPPKLQRSDKIRRFLAPKEEELSVEINPTTVDEVLNELFN